MIYEKSTTIFSVAIFSILGLLLSITGGLFTWFIVSQPAKLSRLVEEKTQQIQAGEEQIRLERDLSESIINSLPGVFYLFDEHGRNLRWNKNLETVGGYTSEEISRIHPLDFFNGDDKDKIHHTIKDVFATGQSEVEATLVDKQGKMTPYYFNGRAIIYQNKPCVIGVGLDITQRKNAEYALKESEEKYRYLFNNNPALIIIWDTENFKVMEVNEQALEQYGYTRQEFLNMTVFDYRPVEDYDAIKEFARLSREGDNSKLRKTWRYLNKKGELMYMDISSHRIDYMGRKAILSLAKDITEQVLAENKLKETYEDIRRLNNYLQTIREEERSTISREIHDELGQLLTGIKMDVSWLSKKFPEGDAAFKDKSAEVLGLIDETIKTVRRIASDLRPGILDDLGLVAALEWQSGEFEKRSGIPCRFTTPLTGVDTQRDVTTGFFRMYQE